MTPADHARTHLRAALRDAMRARESAATAAIRGALAAIDQAEAVPAEGHEASVGTLEDVARRRLTAEDVTAVLRAEREEHERAESLYRDRGDEVTADAMHVRATTIARLLPEALP